MAQVWEAIFFGGRRVESHSASIFNSVKTCHSRQKKIGSGLAPAVIDLKISLKIAVAHTNYPAADESSPLSLHNLTVHVLRHGDRYNYQHRAVLRS